jgi:flagellar M-ring protein FliF
MDQIKKLYKSLSVAQRWSILICGLLLASGVSWLTRQQHEASFRPLFTSLSAEDASGIVQKLKEKGIEYRISENGASILVPETRVAELRLEMAGAGLPKTGRIGYEIFDKTNFGITDFAEHVNYRRAVEGELERSIMSIAEVEQARVHVTFPKDSVFLESREPAKASVLVRLRPGASLSTQNVAAITHLISSAVEGLAPTAVTVVDMRGNLLNRARRTTSPDGDSSDEALEYQQKIERDLQAKISGTLEPLLGTDKFRTALSVDCDMSAGEQSEEVFDPTKSVMATSQRTEDIPGTTILAGGQPGTASNLPHPPPLGSGSTTAAGRRVENVTYQSSRMTRHTKIPQGAIKRLSIAVLVDQGVQWQGKGAQMQRVLVPPTPEKMKTIHDLVATAVGLMPARGDQLTVETLPFDSTLNGAPPISEQAPTTPQKGKKPDSIQELLKGNPILLWGGVAGAVVILLLGFLLLRRKRTRVELVERNPELTAGAAGEDAVALSPDARASALANSPGAALQLPASRIEIIAGQLRESATQDAEAWAHVLRSWLAEEERG